MVGLGGGSFEILLPKDVVVDIGSKIIVPGIGSYIYAEAEKKISDVRNPIDKIIAVTPVNINSIRFVEVEK